MPEGCQIEIGGATVKPLRTIKRELLRDAKARAEYDAQAAGGRVRFSIESRA